MIRLRTFIEKPLVKADVCVVGSCLLAFLSYKYLYVTVAVTIVMALILSPLSYLAWQKRKTIFVFMLLLMVVASTAHIVLLKSNPWNFFYQQPNVQLLLNQAYMAGEIPRMLRTRTVYTTQDYIGIYGVEMFAKEVVLEETLDLSDEIVSTHDFEMPIRMFYGISDQLDMPISEKENSSEEMKIHVWMGDLESSDVWVMFTTKGGFDCLMSRETYSFFKAAMG